jgi:hypothetical protein
MMSVHPGDRLTAAAGIVPDNQHHASHEMTVNQLAKSNVNPRLVPGQSSLDN